MTKIDPIDARIMRRLADDGRASNVDLATEVGLSASACSRRIADLERRGAIVGYRAVIDPVALGLDFEAIVFVTMNHEDRETLLGFEHALAEVPEVLLAQRLFGDPDYLIRVRCEDVADYSRLEDDVLAALPGVLRLTTTLVNKTIVADRPFPMPGPPTATRGRGA